MIDWHYLTTAAITIFSLGLNFWFVSKHADARARADLWRKNASEERERAKESDQMAGIQRDRADQIRATLEAEMDRRIAAEGKLRRRGTAKKQPLGFLK